MDNDKTIRFLLDNAARSDARLGRIEEGQEKNTSLTTQLIGLMSQQTTHHHKLAKEMDRRFKDTDARIEQHFKETSEMIRVLAKKIDALVSDSLRTNGHGTKRKQNGA
jgi:hypothetical protein